MGSCPRGCTEEGRAASGHNRGGTRKHVREPERNKQDFQGEFTKKSLRNDLPLQRLENSKMVISQEIEVENLGVIWLV